MPQGLVQCVPAPAMPTARRAAGALTLAPRLVWRLRAPPDNKYFGIISGNKCYCSSTLNSLVSGSKKAESNCNKACAGDADEKRCGGSSSSRISVWNLASGSSSSIAPPYNPEDGSLCEIDNAFFHNVPDDVVNLLVRRVEDHQTPGRPAPAHCSVPLPIPPRGWLRLQHSIFPESPSEDLSNLTPQQRDQRAAFLSPDLSPNLHFATAGSLNITFVLEGAGYKNQFGVFYFNANNNKISGSMVLQQTAP